MTDVSRRSNLDLKFGVCFLQLVKQIDVPVGISTDNHESWWREGSFSHSHGQDSFAKTSIPDLFVLANIGDTHDILGGEFDLFAVRLDARCSTMDSK